MLFRSYIVFNDLECLAPAKTAMLVSCYVVEGVMIVLNIVSSWTYTREYMPYLKKALERT